ncbi:MAG: GGDEF domain-containing protein [Gammaproteobacteria bacterium]|nr:GGDEF domain-containing protein [Gammaproteobacteria bacterium]
MAIQANNNNIIDARNLATRRGQKATVESLVRLQTPPDTLRLTTTLQTTLELEGMITLFMEELNCHLPVEAIGFRHAEYGVVVQLGEPMRHRSGYGLCLLEENLGEISISRNKPFSEKDLATIEHLLVPLLYPLRNGLRYHAALTSALRDPLTGTHNRTAMDESLPREVTLALRHEMALSMLVIDLDHFKKINDDYGHATGDSVLRTTARVVRQALRTSDQIFRFGGEEFVVLLPSTTTTGARILAERIREKLEVSRCHYEGGEIAVTASIGIASLELGDNQHTLFDKADKALYRAKALGRNQVQHYEA